MCRDADSACLLQARLSRFSSDSSAWLRFMPADLARSAKKLICFSVAGSVGT